MLINMQSLTIQFYTFSWVSGTYFKFPDDKFFHADLLYYELHKFENLNLISTHRHYITYVWFNESYMSSNQLIPFSMSDEPAPIWDADLEVCLFESMQGHKPVGFNKHFHMMCIQHK